MKNTVSTKGQIILPAEIRQRDSIELGQEFEIKRIRRGEYRLKRKERQRNEGLVKLLLACPVKGWFEPMDRKEHYQRHQGAQTRITYLVDANGISPAVSFAGLHLLFKFLNFRFYFLPKGFLGRFLARFAEGHNIFSVPRH